MSSLMKREPFEGAVSLQRAMDRLFDESFVRSGLSRDATPAVDMYETDESVVVKLTIPGVKPEDIEVTIVGDTLTVKGQTESEKETQERSYHLRERHYGRFMRTVTLPTPVQSATTTAEFENGVLTLTAPKREEVKPKVVQVKTIQAATSQSDGGEPEK